MKRKGDLSTVLYVECYKNPQVVQPNAPEQQAMALARAVIGFSNDPFESLQNVELKP